MTARAGTAAAVAAAGLWAIAAAGGAQGATAGGLAVTPVRDHFCTKAGATCRRPEIAVIVTTPQAAELTGVLERRPLRRPRGGAFHRDGTVRVSVPAGRRRRAFTTREDGSRIGVGDYRLTFTGSAGEGPVTIRFFVRPS